MNLQHLKARECIGDHGNSWSVLFLGPGFWGYQCSEGEALSVATLEKLQAEHQYEISSPERLVGFGCPLLVRTWMDQIHGVADKLHPPAHAQKHLCWHLHCRDQWSGARGFQRFTFDGIVCFVWLPSGSLKHPEPSRGALPEAIKPHQAPSAVCELCSCCAGAPQLVTEQCGSSAAPQHAGTPSPGALGDHQ